MPGPASSESVLEGSAAEALRATADRWQWIGLGAVALVAAAHAAHDAAEAHGGLGTIASSALVVGQCIVLAAGYAWVSRRKVARWASLACGVLVSAGFGIGVVALHDEPSVAEVEHLAAGVVVGLGVAGLWLLLVRLPVVLERGRLQALESASLRREAELARLRVHLHPHFLLNTLNAVAGLVGEDPDEARRLLAALGDLVRDALAGGDETRPFAEDLAWLERYAGILETRHRGRLSFRWEIDPATRDVRLPRLLLQPLVENAVRHGALRGRDGGSVLVRSETADGGRRARFLVVDDGPGMDAAAREGLGIGLVRRRLALACPGGSLELTWSSAGTRAVVEVRLAPEAAR